MSIVDELYSLIDSGRKGSNEGLKTGLPKLDLYTGGFQRSTYKLIFGASGSGKSSLVIYSDIYRILKDYPDKNIKLIYFSLEMNSNVLLSKLLNLYVYETYGIEISYLTLLSVREKLPDVLYNIIQESRSWLEGVQEKLIIYDFALNADLFYHHMMNFLEEHGEFQKADKGRREKYIPKDETLLVNVVLDHAGLLRPSKGRTKKEEIDLASSYCVSFRERCKVSFSFIMQENRNTANFERRKMELSEPTGDDVKDSGQMATLYSNI